MRCACLKNLDARTRSACRVETRKNHYSYVTTSFRDNDALLDAARAADEIRAGRHSNLTTIIRSA
eukprot:4341852-Pyramimonas_sp.AAC.1